MIIDRVFLMIWKQRIFLCAGAMLPVFLLTQVVFPDVSRAQIAAIPGVTSRWTDLSPVFTPTLIKGLTINASDPFQLEFLVQKGDDDLQNDLLEAEIYKLIKYFLASLTTPEDDLWVNLSPRESGRIIPGTFGRTEMGRDLLSQDYILKQITASLMFPEGDVGRIFWEEIYRRAAENGVTEIPEDLFHKVWIVPQTGHFYEVNNTVFIVDSHLKVMLEEDYLLREASQRDTTSMNDDVKNLIRQKNWSLRHDNKTGLMNY